MGGANAGRRWLHRPSGRGDNKMAHRAIGPLLILRKIHGEGLLQCTATNAQNYLELK